MGWQESRDKRNLHRKVLDRFRAEYKIRKKRRWVQKAVEFVPNKTLGWLKAVRACLNLKFRKGPENPIRLRRPSDKGVDVSRYVAETEFNEKLQPPFPFWWAWSRDKECGCLVLWRGSADADFLFQGSESHDLLKRYGTSERVFKEGGDWTPAEALGGPHLEVERRKDLCSDCGHTTIVRKRYTFSLSYGPPPFESDIVGPRAEFDNEYISDAVSTAYPDRLGRPMTLEEIEDFESGSYLTGASGQFFIGGLNW